MNIGRVSARGRAKNMPREQRRGPFSSWQWGQVAVRVTDLGGFLENESLNGVLKVR